MKFLKYSTLCMGVMALVSVSCSDFLDQVPDERTEIDTEDKVVSLLVSAYPDNNPAWVCEMSSDNLIDNQAPHLPSSPNDKQILSHYNYSHYARWDNSAFRFEPASEATYSDWDSPGTQWQGYYGSIATANHAIASVEAMKGKDADPSTFSETLRAAWAEAHLIRAYDHFMLVNIFSNAYRNAEDSKKDIGVPYVTECENVVRKDYDRSNVADVYAKIGQDLEVGLKYISDYNYKTAPKYHFNVNAAHAFAARYYLFTRQWEKVIEHANFVLSTDSAQMQKMVMDYSVFGECSNSDDYSNAWQHPSLNNNLMLLSTYSIAARRVFGYRYSCASTAAREALMIHNSPLWSGYICPAHAIVGAMIWSSSSADYGFYNNKIGEQFQYSDKIAGIGYPHVIYRAFTGNETLLMRAEAEIMLARYDEALSDLMFYWNSALNSFSEQDYKAYVKAGYTKFMTPALFEKAYVYNPNAKNPVPNVFENWDFTQQTSSDYVIPAEAVPYMNCLNDFRRFETVLEGMRFFDLKRWSMPLKHIVGINSEEIVSEPFDNSRAIEVPWEAISAGMESSRPTTQRANVAAAPNLNALRVKTDNE